MEEMEATVLRAFQGGLSGEGTGVGQSQSRRRETETEIETGKTTRGGRGKGGGPVKRQRCLQEDRGGRSGRRWAAAGGSGGQLPGG